MHAAASSPTWRGGRQNSNIVADVIGIGTGGWEQQEQDDRIKSGGLWRGARLAVQPCVTGWPTWKNSACAAPDSGDGEPPEVQRECQPGTEEEYMVVKRLFHSFTA